MDSYSRNVERLQRMLQECDVLSDAEDDSEGESDFVIEDEVISDSECYDSEHDEPEKQPCQKQPKCDGWLGKTRNHGGRKKCLIQQFLPVLKILFEKDQDLEDQLFKRKLLMSFGNYLLLPKCWNYWLKRPTCLSETRERTILKKVEQETLIM